MYAKPDEMRIMLHGFFDSRKNGTSVWQRIIGAVRLVATSLAMPSGVEEVASLKSNRDWTPAETTTVSISTYLSLRDLIFDGRELISQKPKQEVSIPGNPFARDVRRSCLRPVAMTFFP